MIALYCSDPGLRSQIRAAVGTEYTTIAGGWADLERLARRTSAVVIAIARLDDAALDRLATFRLRAPFCGVVLVTRKAAANLTAVLEIPVEEVIGIDEYEAVLPTAVIRARNRSWCYRLAAGVEQMWSISAELRAALVHICRSPQPVRTVARLASLVGCHRSTLWHQWRKAMGPDFPVRLEDCLGWSIVFHAWRRKFGGSRWVEVAEELRVSHKTLGRLTTRLAGLTLRELDTIGFPVLVQRFYERVLHPAGFDELSEHSTFWGCIPPVHSRR